jgi:hypothetical protein
VNLCDGFRLSVKGKGSVFEAGHGAMFVLSWETNRHVKHAVPHRVRDTGRRISITMSAFDSKRRFGGVR